MKILRMTAGILGICMLLLASCNSTEKKAEGNMPSDSLKTAVAKTLDDYVAGTMAGPVDTAKINDLLQTYLDANPAVFGSCIAMAPIINGTDTFRQSLYMFRTPAGYELKNFGQIYDYTKDQWFAAPAAQKKSLWSDPYFDAPGGNVQMITYSVPFFNSDNSLSGIITADLEIK